MTLFLAAAFHPSLISRLVLLCLFIVISLCGTFIPILKDRNLRRWTVRSSGACLGSLGIIVSISVFSKVYGWESAWLRLIVKDGGEKWLTSKEKGLAFVFVLFALIGTASDWFLDRRYGADPASVRAFLSFVVHRIHLLIGAHCEVRNGTLILPIFHHGLPLQKAFFSRLDRSGSVSSTDSRQNVPH